MHLKWGRKVAQGSTLSCHQIVQNPYIKDIWDELLPKVQCKVNISLRAFTSSRYYSDLLLTKEISRDTENL